MHYHYLTLEQRSALARVMSNLPEDQRKALREPDYGVCRTCGGDIAFVRLLAEPLARLCRDCKS